MVTFISEKAIRILKVENGFLYSVLGPEDGSDIQPNRQWVSGAEVLEIGRTVLKIFDLEAKKTIDNEKTE